MPTFSKQVAASADDGYWNEGTTVFVDDSQAVLVGQSGTNIYNTFMRFTGVDIPKNAIINSAYLEFVSIANDSGTTLNTLLAAVAHDNPAAPADYNSAESAARTSASVPWNSIGSWSTNSQYQTPNVSTIIQEIVNRPGWELGNAITLYWETGAGTSASAIRRPMSWDVNPSECPTLHVDWTPPPPTYTLTFTLEDTHSTEEDELQWWLYTEEDEGGELLASGTTTNGEEVEVGIFDPFLVNGTNERWLYWIDGANNSNQQVFEIEAQFNQEYEDLEVTSIVVFMNDGTESVMFTEADGHVNVVVVNVGTDTLDGYDVTTPDTFIVSLNGIDFTTLTDLGVTNPILSVLEGTDQAEYTSFNPLDIVVPVDGIDTATFIDTNVTDPIIVPTYGIDFRTFTDTGVTYPVLVPTYGTEQADLSDLAGFPIIGILDGNEQYIPIGDFDVGVLMTLVASLSGQEQMIASDLGVISTIPVVTDGMDASESHDTGSTIIVTPTTGTDVRVLEDLSSQGILVIPTGGVDSSVLTDLGVLDRIVTVTDGAEGAMYQDTGVGYPLVLDTSGTEFFGWTDLNTIYTMVSSLSGTEAFVMTDVGVVSPIAVMSQGTEGIVAEDLGGQVIVPVTTNGTDFRVLTDTDGVMTVVATVDGMDNTTSIDTDTLFTLISQVSGTEQMDAGDTGVLYPLLAITTSSVEGMDNEDVGVIMPIISTTGGTDTYMVGLVVPVRVVHFGVDVPYKAVIIV